MAGLIDLLDHCPMPGCNGDLEPHCVADPRSHRYSHTCDIVRCLKCNNIGCITGQWWPRPVRQVDEPATVSIKVENPPKEWIDIVFPKDQQQS